MMVSDLLIRSEANLRGPEVCVKPHIQKGQSNLGMFPGNRHTRRLGNVGDHVVRRMKNEDIINISSVKTVEILKIQSFIEGHIQIGENRPTMDSHWDTVRLVPKSIAKLKNRGSPEKLGGA